MDALGHSKAEASSVSVGSGPLPSISTIFYDPNDKKPSLKLDDAKDDSSLSTLTQTESSGSVKSKSKKIKRSFKDKLGDVLNSLSPSSAGATMERTESRSKEMHENETESSLQDKILFKLAQSVFPSDHGADATYDTKEPEESKVKEKEKVSFRKGFGPGVFTNNFRRFNSRIGVVFLAQYRAIALFSWAKTSHTLAFLAIYSFICLDPYLITLVPFAHAIIFLLVPAFMDRHPPPPSMLLPTLHPDYSLDGPPLAPAKTVKPAPEMSKDFFRNMRDLQNSMDDFATLHDLIVDNVTPLMNFSNESVSSAIFIGYTFIAILLFFTAHLLPWRLIALFAGWAALIATHPVVKQFTTKPPPPPSNTKKQSSPSKSKTQTQTPVDAVKSFIVHDINVDMTPENREVEVFEVQREVKPRHFDPWLFSPSSWEPTAPARLAGELLKGSRNIDGVLPPGGWEWYDRSWTLDLISQDWVEERAMGGVVVEDSPQKWVTDAPIEGGYGAGGCWRRRRWTRRVRRMVEKKELVYEIKSTL